MFRDCVYAGGVEVTAVDDPVVRQLLAEDPTARIVHTGQHVLPLPERLAQLWAASRHTPLDVPQLTDATIQEGAPRDAVEDLIRAGLWIRWPVPFASHPYGFEVDIRLIPEGIPNPYPDQIPQRVWEMGMPLGWIAIAHAIQHHVGSSLASAERHGLAQLGPRVPQWLKAGAFLMLTDPVIPMSLSGEESSR